MEDEYMHRRKLGKQTKFKVAPKNLGNSACIWWESKNEEGIVYSFHQEWATAHTFTWISHWMPLEILILCHSFIVTGGKAVRISLLCLLGFGVFWDGVEIY